MQTQNILILTVDEARERLVEYYVQSVTSNIKQSILSGEEIEIPNVAQMDDLEIAEKYGELNLGEPLAELHQVPLIVVQTDDYDLKVVWDIDNVPANERIKFMNPNLHQTPVNPEKNHQWKRQPEKHTLQCDDLPLDQIVKFIDFRLDQARDQVTRNRID